MSEKLAITAGEPEKEPGKELEKIDAPSADKVPEGAKTTDEVKEQLAIEASMSPAERVALFEAELAKVRSTLSSIGAKGSTSISKKSFEKSQQNYEYEEGKFTSYEVEHGKFTKLMQDLVRAKLEVAGHSEIEAKFHGMQMLDDEWSALRNETKDKMNGTFTGKLVNWLGNEDDSKMKRYSKIALVMGVSLAAVTTLTAVTGGLAAGGAVAGGVGGAYLRGYKGYVMRASKGRGIDAHKNAKTYGLASEGASFDELLEAGVNDGTYAENVTGNHELNRKAAKGAAIGIALGATAGAAFDYFDGAEKLGSAWNSMTGGNTPPVPGIIAPVHNQGGSSFAEAESNRWAEYKNNISRFEYNKDKNPFFPLNNKPSTHAMGPALESNPQYDLGIDGWTDLVHNRWVNSPEQFASVVSAMGIDGNIPNNIDSADSLAEHFKVKPADHAAMHAKVIDLLNQPTTKVYEAPILNDYASEFGVGNEKTGDVDLAWDPQVDGQRGTKIVIEFKDPNTGEMRKIELRKECGGQRIVEFQPAPVQETPRSVWSNPTSPEQPSKPNHPGTPGKPPVEHPPVQPPEQPPEQPPQPPEEEHPPVQPPDDSKQGRNPGTFADQGSGPLTGEIPVATEVTGTTGRDIGGGQTEAVHTDVVTNEQGTQQNGAAQNPNTTSESQSTSQNSGAGGGVGQGDTSGGTTSTDNGQNR